MKNLLYLSIKETEQHFLYLCPIFLSLPLSYVRAYLLVNTLGSLSKHIEMMGHSLQSAAYEPLYCCFACFLPMKSTFRDSLNNIITSEKIHEE